MATKFINRYHFLVEWGGSRIEFLEVSGLEMGIEVIAVREGSSKVEFENKIPGLLKFSDVTLTRAIQKGDNDFFNWINTKAFGAVERRDVNITLLNERHEPLISWRLKNCFPVRYIGPVLVGNSSSVATETLIITHEGMVVESFAAKTK
ncbi:MAG: phage tail protein [Weeksellaceae bacterium]|nr:phage tail protein [Weeksellaceae bacterium]